MELSAAIIEEYSQMFVFGMSHYKRLINENRDIRIVHDYLALVAYDSLLTLGSEVTFFWEPRRLNGAMILFLLNRYLTFVVQILTWVPSASSSWVGCFMQR